MCRSEVKAGEAWPISLLDPLDAGVDPGAEKLWQAEILRRAREIDGGSVQLVPWSKLRSQLGLPI
jgi:hypothetical protein